MSSRLSVDQILFPTSVNLSDNENMLDHYDEGSFTPYWTSSGVTSPYQSDVFTSASYEARTGFYVRIGGIVLWQAQIKLATPAYTNGGADSQQLALVIDDIPHREGNLFSDINDPASNLLLWGGAHVNHFNNLAGSGWSGFGIFAYGPNQYDSVNRDGFIGVVYLQYLGDTGTMTNIQTQHVTETGNHILIGGQYFASVNNFGTK
jgi:hypothetical protein